MLQLVNEINEGEIWASKEEVAKRAKL
jgi:hypothetical protein